MATKRKSAPAKKPTYGTPEKPNVKRLVLAWGFIVLGIGAIIWLIMIAVPEKPMTCSRPSGQTSLIEWGTCTTDPQ